MTKRHILIFEPDANGHQMESVRFLLTSIDQETSGTRVTLLTTDDAAEHPNCVRLIAEFSHLVTLRIAPPVTEGHRLFRALGVFYETQWRNAEQLSRVLDESGADDLDFILLPHLESIGLLQLRLRPGLFRGKPWATIAVAIRFLNRRCGIKGPFRGLDILQRIFFNRVMKYPGLTCFGSVNPYFARAARHPKVAYCPEPCAVPVLSDSGEAREAYGLRPETIVILVYGILDRRKCIDILLEGAALIAGELDLTVLLAGPQHRRHLAPALAGAAAHKLRQQGRLIEVNRFILRGRGIDPMSVADIAWTFYERDFVNNSNVLVTSGLSRRPVIARDQGVIGRQVQDYQCGLVLSSEAPDAIAAALARLAHDPDLRRTMGENGSRAFARNTPEYYTRPIMDAIGRATAI
jgi:glycosyltransferase involved in cell wall biosynthesis